MAIFNSYVKLPEGIDFHFQQIAIENSENQNNQTFPSSCRPFSSTKHGFPWRFPRALLDTHQEQWLMSESSLDLDLKIISLVETPRNCSSNFINRINTYINTPFELAGNYHFELDVFSLQPSSKIVILSGNFSRSYWKWTIYRWFSCYKWWIFP